MLGAARPLTWIEHLAPLKELENIGTSDCVLIGGGYMPVAPRQTIGEIPDATPQLWAQMRRKSPIELAAIRAACATLSAAVTAVGQSKRSGASVTTAILAGERAANDRGAQDVRTLFSVNGGRTLQPFERLIERAIDPLQLYIAVRHFNYWAEGFGLISERPCPAAEKADALLRRVLPMITAGSSTSLAADFITSQRTPYHCHPVAKGAFGNSTGLTLEEPPYTDLGATFEAGEIYSLKVGVTDGADQHAIVSAMIALREDGSEVLWQFAPSIIQTN